MPGSKLKSISKKTVSILKNGIDPAIEGFNNFNNPTPYIETLAESRTLTCLSCPEFQKEPIESFRVTDIRIPELSEMFCNQCGCTSSYKLRQSITKCKLWKQ